MRKEGEFGMLPEKFKDRMKDMLCDEYEPFISALTEGEAVRGVRICREKVDTGTEIFEKLPKMTPLSYCKDGYILHSSEPIGAHPCHHAGLIYMQDPGAMASLAAIDIPKGAKVLDSCAAPGGKSGQAAAMIGEDGFLLSNEYVPKRAKILVGNFERLGIKCATVTSLDTARLGELYEEYFDLVIADVPCSGEGMFRKSEEALSEWSEENVRTCALRQSEILENLYSTVKRGGHILYSTCTWSLDECEMIIYSFLKKHPDIGLVPVREELRCVTCDGIPYLGMEELKMCRRFYPHKAKGEGQFVALLKKDDGKSAERLNFKDRLIPLKGAEREICEGFLRENLVKMPKARLGKLGENILLAPCEPAPPNSVFMHGVILGEIRGKILSPSHQFFSAYGSDFKRKYELSGDEEILEKYLRGEEISAPNAEAGYTAITYLGAAIGGGKASGGVIKNHYPKGLRTRQG